MSSDSKLRTSARKASLHVGMFAESSLSNSCAYGNEGPDRLDNAERPRSLQKAVNGRERAGAGKREDEVRASILEGIEDHHGGNRDDAEQGKRVHRHTLRPQALPYPLYQCERCTRDSSRKRKHDHYEQYAEHGITADGPARRDFIQAHKRKSS